METEPLPPFDLASVVLDPALPLPDLLRSVERQIAVAPVEIAFAFSADAELLVSKVGDARRVRFSLAESHKMHDAFFTHNHPSGGFLSLADLVFAHDWNLRHFRAAVRTVTFVLHRPPDGWNSAALKRLITQAVARAKRKNHDQPLTQPQADQLNARIVEVALRTLSLEVVTEPL